MDYIKILRWSIITLLCALPFVSFIIADGVHFPVNMFFPYITGKNFMFRILVEVAAALYILLAIRQPKYRPRASWLMWAAGLFALWMAVATFASVDPIKSFWSNFERMDGYITLIHLYVLFVIAGAVLTADNLWERFFQTSVGVSVIQGIYALLQAFELFGFHPSSQSGARADTTFGNATYLAVFMLFNVFITLYLMLRDRSLTSRTLYGVALVLQFAGLFFTQSRGPLLGLVGGLVLATIYIALFAKGNEWKRLRKLSTYALGALVVVIALFFALKNTPIVQNSQTLNRIASISLTDRTTQARFLIWGEALQGIQERPVLGWGQENFSYVFNKYYNPQMYDQEQWFDRAHNEFLDWAIAGGVPAFLLYLSLFVLAVWAVIKSNLKVPEQAVFLGLIAAYGFNNLFVFDNLLSFIYFFAILAFIHGASRKEPHGWMFMSRPLGDHAVAIAAPIVLVALVWGGWVLNGVGMARAQQLIVALTPVTTAGAQKPVTENINDFRKTLNMGQLGYQETVEQLFQYSSNQIARSNAVSPNIKQEAYKLTLEAGDSLLKQRPGDARIELFYSVFLTQIGDYKGAMDHLIKALAASPKKQQILFEVGSNYFAAGDKAGALGPLKEAYDLTPQYDQGLLYYATALYYNKQIAAGDELLTKRYGNVYVDNDQIMQAYFTNKQYDRLKKIYDQVVIKDPTDMQAKVAAAVLTYFTTGSRAAGVAELQKLITANPSVASQIQPFIDQINNGTLKP